MEGIQAMLVTLDSKLKKVIEEQSRAAKVQEEMTDQLDRIEEALWEHGVPGGDGVDDGDEEYVEGEDEDEESVEVEDEDEESGEGEEEEASR